jgi:hypothetical protein
MAKSQTSVRRVKSEVPVGLCLAKLRKKKKPTEKRRYNLLPPSFINATSHSSVVTLSAHVLKSELLIIFLDNSVIS